MESAQGPRESSQGQSPSTVPLRSVWPTFMVCTAAFSAVTLLLIYTTGGWAKWFPLPKNVSEHGQRVDELFWICTWITGITFVLVEAGLIAFLIHFRHRPGRRAVYLHGSHKLEVIWTVIPTVILIIVIGMSISVWHSVRVDVPTDADADVVVQVLAQQFIFNFKYPGPDGKFGRTSPEYYDAPSNPKGEDAFGTVPSDPAGKDDIIALGTMHVPKGKTIKVHLQSKDVLHSFFLPNFRVKMDAVPGMNGTLAFTPTEAGQFEIVCAELCGAQHWDMRGMLVVHETTEDFEAWLETQ